MVSLHPKCPSMLIALDVQTSDWDEHCSFRRQDEHFDAGFPCHSDHRSAVGHICAVGYAVFRQITAVPHLYTADEKDFVAIKLPDGETISKQAARVHGLTDQVSRQGQQLNTIIRFVVALLKQGAEICSHNLAHETLVWCRDLQKRRSIDPSMLSEEDSSLFLQSLYEGHCTLRLGKQRNGFYRNLRDEFASCCTDEVQLDQRSDAAQNAHMCACLFLYYADASYVKYPTCDGYCKAASVTMDREVEQCTYKKANSEQLMRLAASVVLQHLLDI